MDRDVLAGWIDEGLSLAEMGRRAGKHPATVGYWARKHGLRPAHAERHAARGPLSRTELEALVAEDLTVAQIARRVDRSPTTVRHWLKAHGLATTATAQRRPPAGAELPDGAILRVCARHGVVRHVPRREGAFRCSKCAGEAVVRFRQNLKRRLVTEAGGACASCGYDAYVGALHFHHVDPAEKRFSLSLKGLARAVDEVRKEAQKCVLLCANCHAEVEAGVRDCPPLRRTGRG